MIDHHDLRHPPAEILLRSKLQHLCGVAEMAAEELEGQIGTGRPDPVALALVAEGLRHAVEAATGGPVEEYDPISQPH